MPVKNRLTSTERSFFSHISQVIFTNPFSFDRNAIDMKICGMFPGVNRKKILEKTINEVRKRINGFETSGTVDYRRFNKKDRKLVRNSLLFNFYHSYRIQFDRLISEQMKAGAERIKVSFAKEALSYLEIRGFSLEDSRYFFSLCYQLRRAFSFINQTLVGESPCMVGFRERVWNNIFSYNLDLYNQHMWNRMKDFPTLLLGETGTGKGRIAEVIGRSGYIPFDVGKQCFSESFTQSLISFNLSECLPSHMESALFGHLKDAFAGAVRDHKGIFARCSENGAIFLDEIGEVSLPIQIKLLRVMDKRSYSPMGSHETHPFKGRILAATHHRQDDIIRGITHGGKLRNDFFHSLCSDIIFVPSLRERIKENPSELDDLVKLTLKRILGHFSSDLHLMICNTIKRDVGYAYDWPGNIRELSQCIRRILMSKSYTPETRPPRAGPGSELAQKIDEGVLDLQSLIQGYCKMLYTKHGTYGEVARITKLDRRTVKKYMGE